MWQRMRTWAAGLATALLAMGCATEEQVEREMQKLHEMAVKDSIAQYEIAKRSGTEVDRCIHAGLVAASAIQAKNEELYDKWKKIEAEECEWRKAGAPQP